MTTENTEDVKPEPVKRVAKTLTDQEMLKISLTTKQLLDKMPKRNVRLPKSVDPKDPNYETVQINGYTYTIMKGVDVEVPDEVYQILVRTNRY